MRKMRKLIIMVCIVAMIMTNIPNWDAGADVSGTAPSETGDTLVGNATVWKDEVITLNGNLTINETGNLTLDNVTLLMNCTENGSYHIKVLSGGEMHILNNSNISSANEYRYLFWVRNDSKFEMRDSELHECGYERGMHGDRGGLWINTDSAIIYNSVFSNCMSGILFYQVKNFSVSNCSFSNNNVGVYLSQATNIEIIDCILSENNYGIYLEHSSDNTISNCTISSNNDTGIYIEDSSDNTVTSNQIHNNSYGIYLSFSSNNNIISACYIYNNTLDGIRLYSSSNNKIINCIISSNNETGIYLYNSHDNLIVNSTISGNYSDIYYHDINLYSDSDLNILNTTFNKTSVYFADVNSTLNVSWYLNVNVEWKNNISAEYADVTIFDNLTNEVFNGSTDKNGLIKDIVVQEYTQNQTAGKTFFTPHNVTASQGVFSVWKNVTVNETKIIELVLDHNAPVINYTTVSPEQEYTTDENETVEFKFNVSHPDNLNLTYYWYLYLNETEVENATGALENTNITQEINWTCYFNFTSNGNYTVKVTVSDENATVSCTWVLTVNDMNGRPEIKYYYPPKNIFLDNNTCVIFNVTGIDPDNDAIIYQWRSNGKEVSNENKYIFYAEYNASENAINIYYVEVTVTDGKLSDNRTWAVTVVDWNATYDKLLLQIELLKAAIENITKLIGNITETLFNQTELLENITWLVENITALNMTVLKDKLNQLFIELENLNVTLARLNENLTRIQEELNNATDKIGNLTTMLENANATRDQANETRDFALSAKEDAENKTKEMENKMNDAIEAKNKAEYKLGASVVTAVIGGIIAGFFVSFLLRRKLPKKG
jgi:parallel beta-helix repeat protein